jgi:O-6-methylguanine DNA methyltransferase
MENLGHKETFVSRVHAVVMAIPSGTTLTYGQVAAMAGNPGAARAVGSLLKKNFNTTIPCHRVVRSDGTLGQYNRGGSIQKRALLEKEGAILAL